MFVNTTSLRTNQIAKSASQRLGFADESRFEELITSLDDLLRNYVTAEGTGGVEICRMKADDKALVEITTVWLDEEGNGKLFWPYLLPGQSSTQPQYDEYDRELIIYEVKMLICAINQSRGPLLIPSAPNNQGSLPSISNVVPRKFTIIAQAVLLSQRRDLGLSIRVGMTDMNIYQKISSLVSTEKIPRTLSLRFFDELSRVLRIELGKDLVVSLPSFFFPLQRVYSLSEQDRVARRSLDWLKSTRTAMVEVGNSPEKRLRSAGQACANLCSKFGYNLPDDLSDEKLPDLLAKVTMLELGCLKNVDRSSTR